MNTLYFCTPLYPRERPGTHCVGGWVDPQGQSGRVRKISPPTGTRSPDRPALSESLYQLRYPGPIYIYIYIYIYVCVCVSKYSISFVNSTCLASTGHSLSPFIRKPFPTKLGLKAKEMVWMVSTLMLCIPWCYTKVALSAVPLPYITSVL